MFLVYLNAQEPSFLLTNNKQKSHSTYNQPEALVYDRGIAKNLDISDIKNIHSPADGVAYALADVASLAIGDQPFQRYVWIQNGDPKNVGAVNYTVNLSWNRASVLVNCKAVAKNQLVRIDLRSLAPRADIEGKDFKELFVLWEKLAFEPYFHIVRTTEDALPTNAKLIKSLTDDPTGSIRFSIDDKMWYKSPAGRTYLLTESGWQNQKLEFSKKENVAAPGVHVGLDQHVMLQSLTQSNAPIVRFDFFIAKSLQTLNGGIYYDLLGIERNPKGQTAQDAFLKKFGADEAQVAKLRSDQRTAMFKSRVTGRPRRVEFFRSLGVRPDSGTGLVTITYDIAEEDIGPDTDPIRNLLNFKDRAREIILERANGTPAFGLFNGDGGLQDSAPDNIVKDHTIPVPYTARLQPAIGCVRCHAPFDGWQPAPNEVKIMLSGYLDVFDDLSDKKGIIPDTLDRLAGLYSGDLSKTLRRARDDYSDVVYIVTKGQTVPQAGATISGIFIDYLYTEVDALIACRELGYDVPVDKAVYFLNLIVPPLDKDILGIAPEDPIIGALKVGLKVQRYQFESVYADMAFRAMQSKIRQKQLKK